MTARLLRLLAVLPVVAALTVTLHVARMGPSVSGCAFAAGTHHAALVVQHADGEPLRTICVTFTEDSITGDDLLQRSGVPYQTADYGSTGKAVCQIDNEPTQYPPGCWTASSPYWAMFVSRGGAGWQTSSRGISSQTFSDGDAEGFRYEGQSDNSTPPSPAGVCPPPVTPTPTPTARASSPATSGASRATASPPGAASPAAAVSESAAVTTTTPAPGATTPPDTTTPTSSPSSAAHPAITGLTAPPSPPAPSVSAGAWTAIALGAALTILLAARLSVSRLRRRTRTEQP